MKQKPTILLQMIIGFSIILILAISISSYFSYRFSSKVVMNKTSQYLLESVIQMSGKIDRMLEEYDRLSLRIALHPDTQKYLKNKNKKPLGQKVSDYNVQKVITHEQAYLGNDFHVELVGNQGIGGFYSPFNIKQMNWYPFLDSDGGMFWTRNNLLYDIETKDLVHGILGVREIKDYSHPSQNIGYMLTVIPVEATENVVGNFLTDPSNKLQVIDSTGHILYSTDSSEFGHTVDDSLLDKVHDSRNNGNISQEGMDGKSVYISSYTSPYSNWTVVTYIDVDEAIMELEAMKNSALVIVILGIVAALILAFFFSWSLSRPIRHLAYRMSNLKSGKLKPYTGTMNNWEVAVLYDSFNHMIENLDETIRTLSYRQIREKQAQLIAMKAQFQPHFLYNSLNTIYYYAISEKQNKLAEMVLSLSELLRYSIQPGSEFVALKEDLKQLNHYIELQRYRYEEKLQINMYVDEELFEYPVMKLLLQPLVENAITHGLENIKRRHWLINISITKEGTMVKFIVEDNGKGMNQEDMETALEYNEDLEIETDKMMHSGIGLSNLHHRVKLIYGHNYGLELSHSSLGGLKVQLVIPFQLDNRGGIE
ncbi:sensor histidine kinase [uncultured Metabacillus sp.]|uniref:cache domain-containing sensor histidine kinase n=1 Tax=uncultured Metabacillus sp. TaxID=2860135 RepID=UPI002602DE35|nr:sensor histidine kinase [uncultured Metabacillus sp.]